MGDQNIAIGSYSYIGGDYRYGTTGYGRYSQSSSSQNNSVAVGYYSSVYGNNDTAVGNSTTVTGTNSTVLGSGSAAYGNSNNTAIGSNARTGDYYFYSRDQETSDEKSSKILGNS